MEKTRIRYFIQMWTIDNLIMDEIKTTNYEEARKAFEDFKVKYPDKQIIMMTQEDWWVQIDKRSKGILSRAKK